MKNIGILTLPLNNYNYGGVLQAYALQTFIRSEFSSHVIHLDRQYDLSPSIRAKARVLQWIHHKKYRNKALYYSGFERFIQENIRLSPPLFTRNRMLRELKRRHIDLVITGSDQVWRRDYAYNISRDLYLDFPFRGKKISYAASFGTDQFDPQEAYSLLNKLDGLSLRESHAQEIFQKRGLISHHHIDPTLLLDSLHYSSWADRSKKSYKGNLLVYMLDNRNSTESWIKTIAGRMGLPVTYVGRKLRTHIHEFSHRPDPMDSIEDWLKAFRDADFIITDSFHGCVFSILFEKNFITVGNAQRGLSRFESLLNMFALSNRLVYPGEDLDKIGEKPTYEPVRIQLESYRNAAKEYLGSFIYTSS